MSAWWTYSLSDFLLFSPRTYYRLFELYNESVWPAHIAAVVLGLAIIFLARRNAGPAIAALLAGIWLWIAWAFHLERYATINWAATYFAAAFALQAALLVWTGVIRSKLDIRLDGAIGRAGLAFFLFALAVQPVIGVVLRDWREAELFALAPDPTAVATLGILMMSERARWHLMLVPLLWCAFSGLTLVAMEAPDAFVTPALAALAFLLATWKTATRVRNR